jgi:hypothetical protein
MSINEGNVHMFVMKIEWIFTKTENSKNDVDNWSIIM